MSEIWLPTESDSTRRLRLHNTVFSQTFSPCGKHMAAGTNFGHIAVYSVTSALGPEAMERAFKPYLVFKGQPAGGSVNCLVSTDRLLISAGNDAIQAWTWTDVISKNPKVVWTLTVPTTDHFSRPEVNSVSLATEEEGGVSRLYAGAGDNKVHVWDLDSGRYLHALSGHDNYIHSVVTWGGGRECVSGSEDGSARIWDTRRPGEAVSVVQPYKHETCARPRYGKWIGCVAVDKAEDWMVCGGGPHLCLWHLRSMTPTTVFHTESTHNTVMFQEDTLVSAGSEPFVHHWSVNGDKRACVPCSPTNVFDVTINDKAENNKVLSIAGNCNKVDVCTNFGYRAFSLTVY